MRRSRNRLTYANVMSTVAVVLALGGGVAYAANTVFSTDIVDDQVYSADVRNDTLTGGGLTAADLRNGSVGNTEVADGQVRTQEIGNGQVQAQDLAQGVAPGARAWGWVSATGNLAHSKQVTSVTQPDTGVFCIDPAPGIDPNASVMVVGTERGSGVTNTNADNITHAEWRENASGCPDGTMEVDTFGGFGVALSQGEIDQGGFDLEAFEVGFTIPDPVGAAEQRGARLGALTPARLIGRPRWGSPPRSTAALLRPVA